MELELDNFARFLHMAVDCAKEIGFTGQFLIEPKPKEPTKHQYDFDVASVLAFLRKYKLIPTSRSTLKQTMPLLAGHTFQHELAMARINGMLGSVDANQGICSWVGTPTNFPPTCTPQPWPCTRSSRPGGLAPGGLNFDAKVRRGSFEPIDLFYGHIAGMDSFARGLKVAHKLLESGELEEFVAKRYSSYSTGIGQRIVNGEVGFSELEEYALQNDQISNASGRQELLEIILNRYLLEV